MTIIVFTNSIFGSKHLLFELYGVSVDNDLEAFNILNEYICIVNNKYTSKHSSKILFELYGVCVENDKEAFQILINTNDKSKIKLK